MEQKNSLINPDLKIAMIKILTKTEENKVAERKGLGKRIIIYEAFDLGTQEKIYSHCVGVDGKVDTSPLKDYNTFVTVARTRDEIGDYWFKWDYDYETQNITNLTKLNDMENLFLDHIFVDYRKTNN